MKLIQLSVVSVAMLLSACQTTTTRVDNSAGRPTAYEDVRTSSSAVQGVGIESQDIVAMTDKMMRDMLANPVLVNRTTPARIQIDSGEFSNESSSRINKNMITDRLRIELNRAANGRMVFVGRAKIAMVEAERKLKESGKVDGGTIRKTQGTAGVDFRLVGNITSLDAADPASGIASRYQQISFEMMDMEYGTIVWGGLYEFKKSAQDDIIYR